MCRKILTLQILPSLSLSSLPLPSLSLSPPSLSLHLSDYAILDTSPYSNTCLPVTCRRVMCSWYRIAAIISVIIPLILLAAVEITFPM